MPLRTLSGKHADPRKGRGAGVNPEGRFEQVDREAFDDGWETGIDDEPVALKTVVTDERAKSIIARNDSPDIPFTQSINPYQGCEHGCIYCFARPSHAYRNLSPGIDFETRIFAKTNAAELLRKELSRPGYKCELIALGANTDPYQPAERSRGITRGILEVCAEFNQPVGIVTKNALVERDIDILAPMAKKGLAEVFVSVTTLEHELARRMEPRCTAPLRRLQAVRTLAEAGIPTGVMVAPVVPLRFAMTTPWKAWIRSFSPSFIFTWTLTVSPAAKLGRSILICSRSINSILFMPLLQNFDCIEIFYFSSKD